MKKKNYNSRIEIRLTENEKETLTTYAKNKGQSISALIRQLIKNLTTGGTR